jgi:carbon monoxide dehydrogenase subunit G
MNFEGTYDVKAPREKVWAFVIDPNKIGRCMPDLKNLEVVEEDRFNAIVRVGIGFIKGDFKFRLEIAEKQPPSHAHLKGTGSGSSSSVDMDTTIDLTEIPGGTRLAYKADVKVGGMMAGLGQRMMGGATEKTLNDVFACVRRELEK